jgi:hypothetical protein
MAGARVADVANLVGNPALGCSRAESLGHVGAGPHLIVGAGQQQHWGGDLLHGDAGRIRLRALGERRVIDRSRPHPSLGEFRRNEAVIGNERDRLAPPGPRRPRHAVTAREVDARKRHAARNDRDDGADFVSKQRGGEEGEFRAFRHAEEADTARADSWIPRKPIHSALDKLDRDFRQCRLEPRNPEVAKAEAREARSASATASWVGMPPAEPPKTTTPGTRCSSLSGTASTPSKSPWVSSLSSMPPFST